MAKLGLKYVPLERDSSLCSYSLLRLYRLGGSHRGPSGRCRRGRHAHPARQQSAAAQDPTFRDRCTGESAAVRPALEAALSELAFGKDVKADCYKIDRYDRDVCTVYVNRQDVGLAQLDARLAWWFRKYAHEQPPKDRIDYQAVEYRVAADRVASDPKLAPASHDYIRSAGAGKRRASTSSRAIQLALGPALRDS